MHGGRASVWRSVATNGLKTSHTPPLPPRCQVTGEGATACAIAAQEGKTNEGCVAVMRRLLQDGRLDPNKPTRSNATPLLIAAQEGCFEARGGERKRKGEA